MHALARAVKHLGVPCDGEGCWQTLVDGEATLAGDPHHHAPTAQLRVPRAARVAVASTSYHAAPTLLGCCPTDVALEADA
jgi:hypothetical protein|eukprot:SAG25_NODE_3245_length_1160_cov_1.158341_2_plen_80_part_00